jgi:ADP-ribose pyrophosphatase YjhB (NUDIX family)
LQRWATDPCSGSSVRMVAGCIPIMRDGRILLVSSQKKSSWTPPKGGWELDECLEEGAIRECYEEAGVLGILGPQLVAFCVETCKARKRRLELLEEKRIDKKLVQEPPPITTAAAATVSVAGEEETPPSPLPLPPQTTPSMERDFCSGWSEISQLSEENEIATNTTTSTEGEEEPTASFSKTFLRSTALNNNVNNNLQYEQNSHPSSTAAAAVAVVSPETSKQSGIRVMFQLAEKLHTSLQLTIINSHDLVPCPAPLEDAHTHTCMTLFPLYVQQVKDSWPEMTRARRAFEIDGTLCDWNINTHVYVRWK